MSADLHALLDSLTSGDRVKATWKVGQVEVAAEGPVSVNNDLCSCYRVIRWSEGEVHSTLTSFEVARNEEVTVTRDDEEELHALLDSLEDGQEVTAEWRSEDGAMTITGAVQVADTYQEVHGYHTGVLRWRIYELHGSLHSVTVRRSVVKRWERDGDE